MKTMAWLPAAVWFACGPAAVADEFRNVKCGSDIPKAMVGQRSSTDKVVKIEAKYRALGLKHLGADEISASLSSINYLICGAEFVLLLDRKDIVRDVIAFPAHSRQSPAFSGTCRAGGRDLPDVFIGVLDGASGGDMLPVLSAWKIDQKSARFVRAPEGLRCPRSSIFTVDGGM
ncbi:hypothetical protein [Bradyrhizobium sp.]|uniref:hypothetical protein n=1 Tax=Bradyrhizobium sp. TaxID=376 RepID=UPI00403787C9